MILDGETEAWLVLSNSMAPLLSVEITKFISRGFLKKITNIAGIQNNNKKNT